MFVVKRQRQQSQPGSGTGLSLNSLSLDKGKGKEKEGGYALTADVLNHFSYAGGSRKGKGRERAMGVGGMDVARWAEEAKRIAVPGGIADGDGGFGASAAESNFGPGRDKIGIGTSVATSEAGGKEKEKGAKGDGETFLVVYDLDMIGGVGSVGAGLPERGQVAEYALKWMPTTMSCRGTKAGVVIVLIRGMPEG